jgi:hypothetical protein
MMGAAPSPLPEQYPHAASKVRQQLSGGLARPRCKHAYSVRQDTSETGTTRFCRAADGNPDARRTPPDHRERGRAFSADRELRRQPDPCARRGMAADSLADQLVCALQPLLRVGRASGELGIAVELVRELGGELACRQPGARAQCVYATAGLCGRSRPRARSAARWQVLRCRQHSLLLLSWPGTLGPVGPRPSQRTERHRVIGSCDARDELEQAAVRVARVDAPALPFGAVAGTGPSSI